MKRIATVALSLLAFLLLPSFTLVESQASHAVTFNGQPAFNAVVIQGGIIAVKLDDFLRAAGAPISMEPAFEMRGNQLWSKMPGGAESHAKIKLTNASALGVDASHSSAPAGQTNSMRKAGGDAAVKLTPAAGQIIAIRKAGFIGNVIMENGQNYLKLDEVLRAFGDGSTRGFQAGSKLQPGQSIQLTITTNPQGILIGMNH